MKNVMAAKSPVNSKASTAGLLVVLWLSITGFIAVSWIFHPEIISRAVVFFRQTEQGWLILEIFELGWLLSGAIVVQYILRKIFGFERFQSEMCARFTHQKKELAARELERKALLQEMAANRQAAIDLDEIDGQFKESSEIVFAKTQAEFEESRDEAVMYRGTVFAVDDDPNQLTLLRVFLRPLKKLGFKLETFSDPYDADISAAIHKPCLIISDFVMPGLNGLEMVRRMRRRGIMSPAIIISAIDIGQDTVEHFCPENNVVAQIQKSDISKKLLETVKQVLK